MYLAILSCEKHSIITESFLSRQIKSSNKTFNIFEIYNECI